MSKPPSSPGRADAARAGSAMNASARVMTMRMVCGGLLRLAAQLGELGRPLVRRPPAARMSSAGSALPSAHRVTRRMSPPASAAAWNRHAQVAAGLAGPERGVLGAGHADRVREPVGAADRGGRVLAAVDRVPPERGRHAADGLRVEHVHRAGAGPDAAGQLEHVVLGRGATRPGRGSAG